jgi:uncharacterized alpha-E superfamily protein
MLLSRTADDLFWLARYVERAENTARIIDAALRLSSLPTGYGGSGNEWESAVIATGNHDLFTSLYEEATRETVVEFLAFSPQNPSSIRSCLTVARRSARAVRTAITVEMWEAVNGAWLDLHRFDAASMTPLVVCSVPGFCWGDARRRSKRPFISQIKTRPDLESGRVNNFTL